MADKFIVEKPTREYYNDDNATYIRVSFETRDFIKRCAKITGHSMRYTTDKIIDFVKDRTVFKE